MLVALILLVIPISSNDKPYTEEIAKFPSRYECEEAAKFTRSLYTNTPPIYFCQTNTPERTAVWR